MNQFPPQFKKATVKGVPTPAQSTIYTVVAQNSPVNPSHLLVRFPGMRDGWDDKWIPVAQNVRVDSPVGEDTRCGFCQENGILNCRHEGM